MNKNSAVAKGRLWIVAAPSGGGKTSLVESAVEKMPNLVRSISFTTREKRVGEIDGKDYVFVDKAAFERLIVEKKMLEYETVFDNYYGTSLSFINEHLLAGRDVVLTIDWQGSRHVRKIVPESKGLEERLQNRGQDNEEVIAKRMEQAKEQASHYDEFDYLIINDDFDKALNELITIFSAERLRRHRQVINHANLISEILA